MKTKAILAGIGGGFAMAICGLLAGAQIGVALSPSQPPPQVVDHGVVDMATGAAQKVAHGASSLVWAIAGGVIGAIVGGVFGAVVMMNLAAGRSKGQQLPHDGRGSHEE